MPPGRMTHRIDMSQSVAGYEGDGMIIITYDIPGGIQVNKFISTFIYLFCSSTIYFINLHIYLLVLFLFFFIFFNYHTHEIYNFFELWITIVELSAQGLKNTELK